MKLYIYNGVQYIMLDKDEKICLTTATGDFIKVENKDNKLTTIRQKNTIEVPKKDEPTKAYCSYCEKMVVPQVESSIPVRKTREIKGDYDIITVEDEVVYGYCPYCKSDLEVSRKYVKELGGRAR